MFFYEVLLTPLQGLGPIVFFATLALVLVRSFITFLICFGLGLAGVGFLGRITPGIKELQKIRGRPIPTALFATGMFAFLSLTFLGSVISPLPIGATFGIEPVLRVNPALLFFYRIVTLLAGFLISLVFAAIFYRVLTSAHRPFGINLDNVDEDALATGIYVLGYLVFLGVVLCSCLLLSSSLLFTLSFSSFPF
jgi:hypothetical protein